VLSKARAWRLGLVGRFALISLVLIVLLGAVSGVVLGRTVRDRAIADAIRTGEVAASIGVQPLLRTDDFSRDFVPLDAERLADLDRALANALSERGVVRIKVWNRQHWLIYSDNSKLVGRWFPSTDLLEDSFAGSVVAEVTDLSAPEEREERNFGELLAVYVPIVVDADGELGASGEGEVVGAFEIYMPWEPIAASIAADTRRLYLTLSIGLLTLYLALYRLVLGASRRLARQAAVNLHQATHDSLTGLGNRASFEREVSARLAAGERTAVAIVDLEGFRQINDTLGHDIGDRVLATIGDRLRDLGFAADDACRLGSDDFALCVTDPSHGDIDSAVRNVLARIEAPIDVGAVTLHVTAAAGVARSPEHGDAVATLIQHADVALHLAKNDHSPLETYDPEIDPHHPEDLVLLAAARGALERREFIVFYQPKLDLRTGCIIGAEALVRWQHPDQGLLGPGAFMPVIEQTDLIREMTSQVLDMAIAQCRTWHDRGLDLAVAVNLSARDALDPRLPALIESLLARHRVPPRQLECELTESAVLRNPARARLVLGQLERMGVRVSIDDFGTGYASLATLTALPIGALKIDQSFVKELVTNGQGAAIVSFSIALGHDLGLHVVAEGVEDAGTLERLRSMGCHIAQGYHIARPLPADDLEMLVRTLDTRTLLLPVGAST
jgi:diguanylate cyclase (GGDEF)-like protein